MAVHNFKTWCREKGPSAIRESLLVTTFLLIFLACLPVLALVLFFARGLLVLFLILAMVAAGIAFAFSPAFRHWLH